VTGPELRDIVENALVKAKKQPSLGAVHAWLVNFEARQDHGAFGSAPIHVVMAESGRGSFCVLDH
jgi:hypothetical protein